MSKTYFCSSDIHSFYDLWMKALLEQEFNIDNPEHIIIVCGDLFDRGYQSYECLKFVNKMIDLNRIILIKGNHESLLKDCLMRRDFQKHDYLNGTVQTCIDLYEKMQSKLANSIDNVLKFLDNNKELNKYLKALINYWESPNYIFVHSWIPTICTDHLPPWYVQNKSFKWKSDWREASYSKWENARWRNPFEMAFNGLNQTGKTLIVGHWHASALRQKMGGPDDFDKNADFHVCHDPDHKIIALDACSVRSGFVNVLKLSEEEL